MTDRNLFDLTGRTALIQPFTHDINNTFSRRIMAFGFR